MGIQYGGDECVGEAGEGRAAMGRAVEWGNELPSNGAGCEERAAHPVLQRRRVRPRLDGPLVHCDVDVLCGDPRLRRQPRKEAAS